MEKDKHLSKAKHNEDFFRSLDILRTRFPDWAVVGIFYAAMHYYESYFAGFNKHARSHDIYDDWILNDTNIEKTYEDYRELKQCRWYASYWNRNFSAQEIQRSILPKLQNIKALIFNLNQ